jgi:Apea-like HEPN
MTNADLVIFVGAVLMPIQDSEVFDQFLTSLTLQQPKSLNDFEKIEAVPERGLSGSSQVTHSDPIYLWYAKSCRLTPNSMLQALAKQLQGQGHAATIEMAKAVLAILCLTSASMGTPVERLNTIIEAIGPADSSQFWIFPYPPHSNFQTFHLGRFSLGKLHEQKLIYRCQKARCDFFKRYPNQFSDRLAIERQPISVPVLDWVSIYEHFKIFHSDVGAVLLDYYFESLTRNLQDDFRQEFRIAQQVLVAAGAPYIDLDRPQVLGGAFVSIYQKIGKDKSGYFCPLDMFFAIDFAQIDQRYPDKAEELKNKYAFTGLGNYEIHQSLGTYCRFIVKAKIYEDENRRDEAFLHYVIALDLLFGEKDASTQKISKRTALVVSRARGEGFNATVKRIKTIYEKRSKYVHAGISVADQDVELLQPVIEEVLLCLLRLQSVQNNRADGFFESWLKRLDYFIAAIEADKEIEDKDLIAAGLS